LGFKLDPTGERLGVFLRTAELLLRIFPFGAFEGGFAGDLVLVRGPLRGSGAAKMVSAIRRIGVRLEETALGVGSETFGAASRGAAVGRELRPTFLTLLFGRDFLVFIRSNFPVGKCRAFLMPEH
jgi:hypothetical protein